MNFSAVITQDAIASKFILSEGLRIMIDSDLAELYGVETNVLNQAVKRNIERFPADFMFDFQKRSLPT